MVNCMPPFCADEPSLYGKCEGEGSYIKHVIGIASIPILILLCIATCWVFSTEKQSQMSRSGSRVINVHAPTCPDVEDQSDYRLSTDGEAETEFNDDEPPPPYESLIQEY